MSEPNGDNFFPLDDDTIGFFQQGIKQIQSLELQMTGALQLYVRQHKLEGTWKIADNGREIQRVTEKVNAA